MVYDVLVVRYGWTSVEANSPSDAITIVNGMCVNDIDWSSDWEATDAEESEGHA